ncbi:MAG: gliding motility-associated C-terminal domain-containing protein, partial [Cyclobacteriaceae bacterium]|nr:gliding motility-associated C-terminal domain-containing protein [Cyclobacteriaceae bacterium]
ESEMVQSLVVNSKNQLVILGVTSSFNFPTHDQAFDRSFNGGSPIMPIAGVPMYNGSDIFVAVLSEDGSQLISSTFLGGNNSDGVTYNADKLVKNYGDESRGDIYVDEFDNIYVASRTNSTDFPVINAIQDKLRGAFDGVIVKLTSQLDQILWSTYFGGEDTDAALSIKTNSNGNIIVAGGTASPDLYPQFLNTYFGEIDGWVAVFSPDGSILESGRYVGTSGSDQSYFVDVDISDNVYLFGITDGEYPIQGNVFQEGSGQFIHKFSGDLSASILSTNFGNTSLGPDISPTAFLVNDCGNIYLSGWGGILNDYETNYFKGTTIGLPITLNAYQGVSTGNDFYLAVFLDDMQELLYATFLGGGINLTHVDGGTSRFDKKGIVYHAVCAGCAAGGYANSDFPTTNGAWSNQNNSSNCNNAAFKFDLSSLDARITTYDEEMEIENLTEFCIPDKTLFVNTSIGGVNFEWDFGDGRKVNTTSRDPILHEYKIPGKYKVTLRIIDTSTCAEEDDTFIYLDVFKYDFKSSEDALICDGEAFLLEASGADFYEWSLKDQTVVSNAASFSITPSESVEYYLRSTKGICEYLDTVFVEVLKKPTINVEIQRSCSDGMKVEIKSEIVGMTDYNWDMGEGTIISDSIFVFQYNEEGDYQIRLSVENEICLTQEVFPVKIRHRLIPSVFTPGIKDNKNDSFVMKGIENASLEVYNRWGRKVYENPDYDNSWTGEDLSAGTYFYYVIGENKEKCKGIVQIIK